MKGGFLSLVFLLLPALSAASGARARDLPLPGFTARVLVRLKGPVLLGGADALPSGELLFFRDNDLVRWNGRTVVKVHSFPRGTMGAFVKATGKGLFAAESTTGTIYKVDPARGKVVPVLKAGYPFDLAESPRGGLFLSANPGWGSGGSGNRIYLVDPSRGTSREVVRLKGPSGPIAFDGGGNLYYATQSPSYPTPPGAVRILRWTEGQVRRAAAGGGVLSEKDAVLVWKGLDGAFGMALDRMGRIYLSDPRKGKLLRLDPAAGKKEILLEAPKFPKAGYTILRFLGGGGAATFDPWQPPGGGRLLVCASDFLSFAALIELRPARPVLTCSPFPMVPPGRIRFQGAGGPSRRPALLLLSPVGAVPEALLPLGRGGPLFLGVLPHPWLLAFPVNTGSKGGFSLDLSYPGGGPLVVFGQVLFGGGGLPFTSSLLVVKLL